MRKDLAAKESRIVSLEAQTASKGQTEQALIAARGELDGVRKDLAAKERQIGELEAQTASKGETERALITATEELRGGRKVKVSKDNCGPRGANCIQKANQTSLLLPELNWME